MFVKWDIHIWESGVKVGLELVERELITFLEFFIVLRELLVTVIGEVDEFVFIVKAVLIRARSHITDLIKVELHVIRSKSENSNVEFSLVV